MTVKNAATTLDSKENVYKDRNCLAKKKMLVSSHKFFFVLISHYLLVLQTKLVLHPGKYVWTLKAGVQVPFTLDLARVELTALGMVTCDEVWVDVFLALPWLKVGNLREGRRRSHPLNCLVVGDEEDVLMS